MKAIPMFCFNWLCDQAEHNQEASVKNKIPVVPHLLSLMESIAKLSLGSSLAELTLFSVSPADGLHNIAYGLHNIADGLHNIPTRARSDWAVFQHSSVNVDQVRKLELEVSLNFFENGRRP